ncbi:MAG: DUF2167 domain-containing protein [Rhodospirillales bacterium]|nr:DUF2167 domain-containing protein [Rhodospirillales bacterium]
MRCAIAFCLGFLVLASAATARIPESTNEPVDTDKALQWRDGKTLRLPVSGATLKAPAPVRQLVGRDAARVWAAVSGGPAPAGIEALLHDPRTGEMVIFQNLGRGYVRFDDWDTLDLDAILRSVAEIAEAGNSRRRRAGLPGIHVVGWLEPPTLDRSTNSVRWAIEASSDHGLPVISSMALVFGRGGFEKLIWGGNVMFASRGNLLKIGQANFAFPVGGRYTDYQVGDRLSEYGIASTIAAILRMKEPVE